MGYPMDSADALIAQLLEDGLPAESIDLMRENKLLRARVIPVIQVEIEKFLNKLSEEPTFEACLREAQEKLGETGDVSLVHIFAAMLLLFKKNPLKEVSVSAVATLLQRSPQAVRKAIKSPWSFDQLRKRLA